MDMCDVYYNHELLLGYILASFNVTRKPQGEDSGSSQLLPYCTALDSISRNWLPLRAVVVVVEPESEITSGKEIQMRLQRWETTNNRRTVHMLRPRIEFAPMENAICDELVTVFDRAHRAEASTQKTSSKLRSILEISMPPQTSPSGSMDR